MDNRRSSKLNGKWGRVLFVEDDGISSGWMGAVSKKLGLDSDFAKNKSEALLYLNRQDYHAVITDIFLDLEGGAEGFDIIKESHRNGIPCIVITGKLDAQVAKRATNMGASYLLEKPFSSDELKEALRTSWENPKGLNGIVERFLDMHQLTEKEKEIARLSIKGLSIAEIGEALSISDKTVKAHLTSIFTKCDLKARVELLSAAVPV